MSDFIISQVSSNWHIKKSITVLYDYFIISNLFQKSKLNDIKLRMLSFLSCKLGKCDKLQTKHFGNEQKYNYKGKKMGCGTSSQSNIAEMPVSMSLDKYDRRDMIGVGNHGRVYRCIHQLDQKQYAWKVIDQFDSNRDKSKLAQVAKSTFQKLKLLKDNHISTYHHAQFTPKQITIITDYMKEGNLKKLIQKNGKQVQSKVAETVQKILQGLLFLHKKGILHKDLKTSNILINRDALKLTDYGLAEIYDCRLQSQKRSSKPCPDHYRSDSLPYMAPEVVKNIEINNQSDIWSVGCIVIEMITGKVPWSNLGSNQLEIFKIISNGVYPPLPAGISQYCQDFLQSCLAIIPTQRSSVEQLLRHSFIRMHSNKHELFFEQPHEKVLKKNQLGERNAKTEQKNVATHDKQKIRSPLGQKSIQNQYYIPRKLNHKDDKLTRLKEAVNSMNFERSPSSLMKSVNKDDIRAEVTEDNDGMIILNNKKVKLANLNSKISDLRQREQNYHQIQKRSVDNSDSLDKEMFNKKFETEPTLFEEQEDHFPPDKQYFKKPLKLLKKKLRQSKMMQNLSKNISQQSSKSRKEELDKLFDNDHSKLRSNTQISHTQEVIDTLVARAERDRYLNEQKFMKKQREEEKKSWEEQLKKGAQILKKQFSNRYAYNAIYG